MPSSLPKPQKYWANKQIIKNMQHWLTKIKNAINEKYLNAATGIYGNGIQTELAVPLYWGVVPDRLKTKVAANLAKRVEADS